MAAPSENTLTSTIVLVAIIVLVVVRRTYYALRGARYSAGRMYGFAGFALVFFALFGATTIYAAYGSWGPGALALLAPYAGVIVLAAVLAEPRVRRTVRFETRADGQVYYRLTFLIPILYLALFTARLGIEVAIFGINSFASASVPSSLPLDLLLVTIVFDLLYAVSVGLLFGRALGSVRAYRANPPASAPSALAAAPPQAPLP